VGIADYRDVLILERFLWTMVSCVGLAFGEENSIFKVQFFTGSKPNLTALVRETEIAGSWYWKFLLF